MKFIILLLIIIVLSLGVMSFLNFEENQSLKSKLIESNLLFKRVQDELKTKEFKQEELQKELADDRNDVTSYFALNTKLNQDKKKLQKEISELKSKLGKVEPGLDNKASTAPILELSEGEKLKKANLRIDSLKKRIATLELESVMNKSTYYYNLGAVYSEFGEYPRSAEAYNKSIQLDWTNADAHYNIAVILENVLYRPIEAVEHYERYLQLVPKSIERANIEKRLEKLRSGVLW